MVPYSQIPLSIHIHVVLQHEKQIRDFQNIVHTFPENDEANIFYILRQYRLTGDNAFIPKIWSLPVPRFCKLVKIIPAPCV